MGAIEVLDPGFFTTVQDAGRFGYRKFGVPVSGAMDYFARKSANWLVGNDKDAPVLEMTLRGGRYRFSEDAIIGITGGDVTVEVNGENRPQYQTLYVDEGEVIEIGKVSAGCRVYMAISGQCKLDKVMGSFSTCTQAGFGGFEGRALEQEDWIGWESPAEQPELKEIPHRLRPYFGNSFQIRVMAGAEWNWLEKEQQQKFLETDFKVSSESNRMGVRLKAETSFEISDRQMVSSPVVPGMIQLPEGGTPIILMNDAQSVGGYPRIAKVIDADLWRIGQAWPPARIRFKMISRKEAIKLSAFQENILY